MTRTVPQRTRPLTAAACLALAALFFCALFPAPAAGQKNNSLDQVAVGDGQGYTRLVLTFRAPLGPYTVKSEPGGRVLVDLRDMSLGELGALPRHEVISGINFEAKDGRLLVRVQVNMVKYELKHFTGRDRYTLNLDFMTPATPEAPVLSEQLGRETLAIPTLAEVALEQSRLTPPGPHDGPAEHLYQRILGNVANHNRTAALEDLDLFLKLFPDHPRLEVVSYLKAELDFLAGPPEETSAVAIQEWKDFLDHWPNSALSSRAYYMMAEADHLLGMDNEAAGQFALLADERDDVYSQRALLKAADLFMGMGLTDEARKIITPVANQGLAERLGWEVYARVGAADFHQGFYDQAADILREVMRQVPDIAETFPEILYILGEIYHYLGEPGLSRRYLIEAVNMLSGHPKTDIILTRIGDSYRLEGLDQEAIAIYGAASRNYSGYEGGLISKVRLADMGSLHSFFSQENVFGALERGSRQATVEMYKTIVDSGFASPLMQLAQLKIGTALAEDGEASEAITWLRDLEINNPRSPLLPEAMPVLSEAVVAEMSRRREMGDWQGVADLYADNSYYIVAADRPQVESLVAQAYERLGRFQDAREMWASLAEETPDKRLVRARGLVVNSLKIGQPQEALKYIQDMYSEFPEQRRWLDEQLALVGRALARPRNIEAVNNLLDLRRVISAEPVRRDALSDAITIEIDDRRYDRAIALIKQYRQEYPDDELSPEYLLTLAEIANYQKRPEQAWDLLSQFRQSYPDDQRGRQILLDQVEKANRLGRPDDAFRFLELFRALYPHDPAGGPLLTEKMNRLWEAGLYDEARDALASFIRDYPEDSQRPEILIKYVERELEKGNYPEARVKMEELLANHRDHPDLQSLILRLAEQAWTGERHDEARELTYLILANYPADDSLADILLKQAEQAWAGENHDEARELTDLILANYPADGRLADILFKQAEQAWAGESHDEAWKLTDLILANYPADGRLADIIFKQAEQSWTGGNHDEARKLTDLILANYPGDNRLADILLKQTEQSWTGENHDEARKLTDLILANYPGDNRLADILLKQAEKRWAGENQDKARELTDLIRANYPADDRLADLLLKQAEQSWAGERHDQARELTGLIRANYPDDGRLVDLILQQAEQSWADGRYNKARELTKLILTNYPGNDRLDDMLLRLTEQAWTGKRHDEALELTDLLLANYPDDGRLADLLLRQAEQSWTGERYDEARELTDLILAKYPDDERLADFFLKRAEGNWERGRFEAALEDWSFFRRTFPENGQIGRSYLDQYKKMMSGGLAGEAFLLADEYRRLRPQETASQADLMLEQAKDYFALDRPDEGLAMWNSFRQTFPEDERNADLLLIQARRELRSGLGDEALGHYQQFLDAYGKDRRRADVYLETAAAELSLNQRPAAWNRLNSYISTFTAHSGRPQAILDAVDLGRQLGHLSEAVGLLELFRRDYPDASQVPGTYLAEARLKLSMGDQAGAVAILENGTLSRPELERDPQVPALLAELYLEEGRVEDWAALVERNLNRAERGTSPSDRFQRYYQLAQVYQELGRNTDVERNLDSALANRDSGVSAENLYAVAQGYKRLLRQEKYRAALLLVRETGDPFWQQVATEELAAETSG